MIHLFYVGALLNDSSCDPHLWIYGVWIDNGYCFICFGPTPWSRSNSDLCCGMQWKIIKNMCSQWEKLKCNWKPKCYALMFVLMEECTTITNYGLKWYFVSSSLCHCWRFLKWRHRPQPFLFICRCTANIYSLVTCCLFIHLLFFWMTVSPLISFICIRSPFSREFRIRHQWVRSSC